MASFDLIAGLASILGLVFSIAAFIKATTAATAAKEARDAVFIRTVADEFQLACNDMDQLLDLITHDRLAEAARVAHALTSALSEIPYRRGIYLSVERKNELLDVRTQLQIIEEQISRAKGAPLTPKQKQTLIKVCQTSSVTMRENLGTIKGQVEVGGKP